MMLTAAGDTISSVSSNAGTGEAVLSTHYISTGSTYTVTVVLSHSTLVNIFKKHMCVVGSDCYSTHFGHIYSYVCKDITM